MEKSDEYSSIVDLIFDKNAVESADFEIAFTATLATVVLASVSSAGVPPIILKIASISLITVTLVRRMAVSSRFVNEDKILSVTMLPIELLTIFTLYYIFYTPSQFISTILPIGQPALLIAALLIPELIMFLIISQELIFKNYMVWWGGFALGQAGNTENPIFKTILGFTALFAFKASRIEDLPEELNEAQEFVDKIESKLETALSEANAKYEDIEIPTSSGTAIATWKVILIFCSFFALITIFLVLAFLLSIVFGSVFQIFLLICSVFFIRHMVQFYYLAYGLPEESQMFGNGLPTILMTYSIHVLGLYFVFVWL